MQQLVLLVPHMQRLIYLWIGLYKISFLYYILYGRKQKQGKYIYTKNIYVHIIFMNQNIYHYISCINTFTSIYGYAISNFHIQIISERQSSQNINTRYLFIKYLLNKLLPLTLVKIDKIYRNYLPLTNLSNVQMILLSAAKSRVLTIAEYAHIKMS